MKSNRTLIFGALDLALHMDYSARIYQATKQYFERYFARVHFEGLSHQTISELNMSEELPENMDVLLYPNIMELVSERCKSNLTALGKPVYESNFVMVTNTPKSAFVSSFDFNIADKWTWFGILTSIFTIALLLATTAKRSSTRRNVLKVKSGKVSFVRDFIKHAWNITMVFFYEPFPSISKRPSQRILCGTWILVSFVIINELTGNMKSKFSFTTYKKINTIEEINPQSKYQPKCLDGQTSESIIHLLATRNRKLQYILDKTQRFHHIDLAGADFFQDLAENDVFLILDYALYSSVGTCVSQGLYEKEELPHLYVSKPISKYYLVYPMSFKMASDKPWTKIFQFYFNTYVETKWQESYKAQNKFIVDSVLWEPTTTETSVLVFMDVLPVYKFYAYGNLIASLALILEWIWFLSFNYPNSQRI